MIIQQFIFSMYEKIISHLNIDEIATNFPQGLYDSRWWSIESYYEELSANRGIGLGIVKQLVSNPSSIEFIFAGYRDANKSKELLDLAKQHSNIIIPIQIDVNDDESCNKAKGEVENKLGNSQGLNCLLNNAGVNKDLKFNDINEQDMLDTYKQNVIGPWRVTKTFLPLVEKAVSGERNVLQASIINVSSAALNMFTVCFAETLAKSNIYIALLHPGWVKTDMGGAQAPLTTEKACKNIVECINSMKDEHYGKLIDSTSGSSCAILPF
ncbi:unnamed protein product [Adineta steineri]|uniref:Uncharacterized protein n=1 Tax=Adineta steineri TaxID=433720 RepID=A0A815FX03_9BILA|nr:unnamed protein product [Adineta steineri]CAF0956698.1 unnamed protein product [Adineta steineri]CAF1331035.1 unnamed protein product [Adineta steineri]CAF1331319.1 unnamed protein product [Adineta steineri]